MDNKITTINLSFSRLFIEKVEVGDDLLILVHGGDKEHIGSVVMSVPRLSITGDGSTSCTSSVLNLLGHKDEELLRPICEYYCKKENKVVTCIGGFHVDDMTQEQILELKEVLEKYTLNTVL